VTLVPLLWLDWHIAVNRVRTIVRNPRRLLPWVLVFGWFAVSLQSRLAFGGRATRLAPSTLGLEQFGMLAATLAPGAALLALGVGLWRDGHGAPATFSSPADARFIIGAALPPRLVLGWLCLRATRRMLVMAVFYLVLFGFTYGRLAGLSGVQAIGGAVAVALFSGLLYGVRLAAFTGGQKLDADLGLLAGVPLTVFGTLSLAASGGVILGWPAVSAGVAGILAGLPPGAWVVAAFRGDLVAVGILAAITLLAGGVGVWLGGDCYPELWTASTRVFAVRRMMRQGGGGGLLSYGRARLAVGGQASSVDRLAAVSRSGARVPGGVWVVAWKEWLTLRRGPGGLPLQALILVGAVAGGVLVYFATREARRGSGILLATEIAGAALLLSGFTSVRMATDLRNPLWWLSSSTLRARLAAWTLSRAARFAVPVAAFVAAYFLVLHSPSLLLAVLVVLVGLAAWFVQVIGLAAYSIFPAAADRRLTQMVRLFSLYAGLIPIVVSVIPGVLLRNLLLAAAGCSVALAAEAGGLLLFAAWRIQNNGLAFAREEGQ